MGDAGSGRAGIVEELAAPACRPTCCGAKMNLPLANPHGAVRRGAVGEVTRDGRGDADKAAVVRRADRPG